MVLAIAQRPAAANGELGGRVATDGARRRRRAADRADVNFLVGLVTGFQSAMQLKQFGANIFVADWSASR